MRNYFSHDFGARNDEKIVAMLQKCGMAGYGVYWAIVEKLYENDGTLCANYALHAFDLRCEDKLVRQVVVDFGLFEVSEDGRTFSSLSVSRRLEAMKTKSEKAAMAARSRYNKPSGYTATTCPHCHGMGAIEQVDGRLKCKACGAVYSWEQVRDVGAGI